jgi:hypothetical protein
MPRAKKDRLINTTSTLLILVHRCRILSLNQSGGIRAAKYSRGCPETRQQKSPVFKFVYFDFPVLFLRDQPYT